MVSRDGRGVARWHRWSWEVLSRHAGWSQVSRCAGQDKGDSRQHASRLWSATQAQQAVSAMARKGKELANLLPLPSRVVYSTTYVYNSPGFGLNGSAPCAQRESIVFLPVVQTKGREVNMGTPHIHHRNTYERANTACFKTPLHMSAIEAPRRHAARAGG